MKYKFLDLLIHLSFMMQIVACVLAKATIMLVVDRQNPFLVTPHAGHDQKLLNLYKARTIVIGT